MTTHSTTAGATKADVRDFWEGGSCGEVYADGDTLRARYAAQAAARYALEPYIFDFARFADGAGRDVLEIGVGMGADHLEWARSRPRTLRGLDLTPRAVGWTSERLRLHGFEPAVTVGDAERLPFPDDSFDIVYSWGVLHHSPDTPRAIDEVRRVLRPGGRARVMIYHTRAIVGYVLWLRYALARGRPGRSLADVYAEHLESPGTKAYTPEEARALFAGFRDVRTRIELSCGDLMEGAAGQRHQGRALGLARRIWPRGLIRRHLPEHGLFLLVDAQK